MSREANLHKVLNSLTLSSEVREPFTHDSDVIKDYIINKMKEDVTFRNYFRETRLVGSYLDDLKIELPDEYDYCIILDSPSSLTPVKHNAWLHLRQAYPNIWTERCNDNHYYVSREKVQQWMRNIINRIFRSNFINITIPETGRKYRVEYSDSSGYAVAHTFSAKSSNQNSREISFDFVPAFVFDHTHWVYDKKHLTDKKVLEWFAVPSPNKDDQFEFNISAPHLERESIKDKQNLKNSIRLLKALKNHNKMTTMQSYVLKTVVLWENEERPLNYWKKPMGEILIEMIESLLMYMKKGHLPFFWETDINLLDRVKKANKLREFENKFESILKILKGHKSKNLKQLLEIF